MSAALDEQPRSGGARLAGVLEDRVRDALRREIEIGIREHDVRRLAAELHDDRHDVFGRHLRHLHAYLHRAGERQLIDVRMAGERRAGFGARTGHDVQDAGRQPAREGDLAQPERGHRRFAGRLEHHRAAGRQRRRNPARADLDRIVPRHDLGGNADGLANREVQKPGPERDRVAHDLVGDAREELEVARGHLHVGPRLAQRLAVVPAFERGQLLGAITKRLRHALHDPSALGGHHPAPRLRLERGMC